VDGLIVGIPFGILAAIVTAVFKDNSFIPLAFIYLIALGLGLYNQVYLQGTTGQSWGKRMLNLKLVGMSDGQPIGPLMAFVRGLAHFVDAIICDIGFLFPLWDARRQTLADKIMSTVVLGDQRAV
jgi:uncharacterized RDD family membrane protein YckC